MRTWVKRTLLTGTLVGLGLGVGALAALMVTYDKPARSRIDSIKRKLGFESYYGKFTVGHLKFSGDSWGAVTSPTHKQWKVRRGFDVQKVAGGLTYPVNMAFVPQPGSAPDDPVFYVNELHGALKYVDREGKLHTYAENLINFTPFPLVKSDEMGVSGMTLVPGSEDLIVTLSYSDKSSGLLSNRIVRLISEPGGKRLKETKILLDLKEFTSPSNQIQQCLFGPDGMLYVSVGDAENHHLSLDLEKFGGKILRMNPDGTPCEDNPFYKDFAPEAPSSYVFAYGVRNVFDLDFHPANGNLYAVDNGKNIDRLFRVASGAGYGWNGNPESIRSNAIYTWGPVNNTAPCGMTFLTGAPLGEGPPGRCYIALYGPAGAAGPNHAKAIVETVIDPASGLIKQTPEPLIQFDGPDQTTVLGLAEGPDGLYFTDFFGDTIGVDAEGKGSIWKVVPSQETLKLPDADAAQLAALPPPERGAYLFQKNCTTCHRIEGVGGREGPELTHVAANLQTRLGAPAYEADLNRLLASDQEFVVEQQGRIREVLAAKGPERIRVWIHHHLEEPRFDNVYGKMPSFAAALSSDQRGDIIAYLLTRQ